MAFSSQVNQEQEEKWTDIHQRLYIFLQGLNLNADDFKLNVLNQEKSFEPLEIWVQKPKSLHPPVPIVKTIEAEIDGPLFSTEAKLTFRNKEARMEVDNSRWRAFKSTISNYLNHLGLDGKQFNQKASEPNYEIFEWLMSIEVWTSLDRLIYDYLVFLKLDPILFKNRVIEGDRGIFKEGIQWNELCRESVPVPAVSYHSISTSDGGLTLPVPTVQTKLRTRDAFHQMVDRYLTFLGLNDNTFKVSALDPANAIKPFEKLDQFLFKVGEKWVTIASIGPGEQQLGEDLPLPAKEGPEEDEDLPLDISAVFDFP